MSNSKNKSNPLSHLKILLRAGLFKQKQDLDCDSKAYKESVLHNPPDLKVFSQVLASQDVDPCKLNQFGNSPLHSVALRPHNRKNQLEKQEYAYVLLTSTDINVNQLNDEGNTALHLAVEKSDLDLVKVLLAFGADINPFNCRGKTPFDLCFINYTYVHGSLLGTSSKATTETIPSNMELQDNLMKLLKDCGGIPGRKRETIHLTHHRRKPTRVFRRSTRTMRCQNEGRLRVTLCESSCLRSKSDLEDDWCAEVASMYYKSWETVMAYPPLPFGDDLKDAADLGKNVRTMRLVQMAGSRILTLDGGGMKGIMEIELLDQIEKATGRKIVELFDWIVGTSVGSFIAAALVYGKLSIKQIRQFFYNLKDSVFGDGTLGMAYNTAELTRLLKNLYGDKTMSSETYPRVIITAVDKRTTNLKVKYFGNHPGIDEDYHSRPIWKVLRYSSAAPMFFEEMDGFVDGGVLVNNPSSCALTVIQEMYSQKNMKIPISLMVSIGTGILPDNKLGSIDVQAFLTFGFHWLNAEDRLFSRAANLKTLLSIAVTESESVATNVHSRCKEQGIDFYRFSPHLQNIVSSQEIKKDVLFDFTLAAKTCPEVKKSLTRLMLRFPVYSDANNKLHDLIDNNLL